MSNTNVLHFHALIPGVWMTAVAGSSKWIPVSKEIRGKMVIRFQNGPEVLSVGLQNKSEEGT